MKLTQQHLKLAKQIIRKRKLCNNCLGRQFAQVSTGLTNRKRGELIRKALGELEPKSCPLCKNLFKGLEKWAKKAEAELKIHFKTFLVGTKLSPELAESEQSLWKETGVKWCEPLKSELNRELGKLLEPKLKKPVDKETPDVVVILNLNSERIELSITPLFFFGGYKKLIRGIPQTKWKMYPESVEDIIARPFMAATKGKGHALHGVGREDIDARCLDWRPFVLEIKKPKSRSVSLPEMRKIINKSGKVNVKDLRPSNKKEVIKLKALRPDKSYRALVAFEKPVKGLERLKNLKGLIKQRTPARVLHRRADLLRKRLVKSIKWKKTGQKEAVLEVKGEAGLYIKELVSGDMGRTKPSAAKLLDNPAKVKELDVIKIWSRYGKSK